MKDIPRIPNHWAENSLKAIGRSIEDSVSASTTETIVTT